MPTIRLTVTKSDYEALQKAADMEHRPIEHLLHEAIASFRRERIEMKAPLRDLPLLSGHRPLVDLPSRADLYEEMFSDEASNGRP